MKGKKIKYSVSAAVLAAMVSATPVFASPIVSQGQINATQGQIDATQGKINDFETKIQKLDNQISIGILNAQKISDSIKAQQAKIDETKAQVAKAQKDLDTHKLIYSNRLRSIQAQGQSPIISYAELLLSSKNLSEFLTRSTAISEILQSDSDIMNTLNEKEKALNDAQQRLHNELNNLKKSQQELAAKQAKIQADKDEVEKALTASKNTLQQQQGTLVQQKAQLAQQRALALKIAQEQAAAARAAAQRAAAQRAAAQAAARAQQQAQSQQHSTTTNASASTSTQSTAAVNLPSNADLASKVIAKAEQYLGVPYVWGGSSPSGFDCSGLMQYSFHSVGVNLPRVAADQQNFGKRISPFSVQPGDLVFLGEPAYHVAMYIGSGEIIQAPQPGDVVKISRYIPGDYASAARVLP